MEALPDQASYATANADWTLAVWKGTAELDAERMFPDLVAQGLPGADAITLDEFKHWAALVSGCSATRVAGKGPCSRSDDGDTSHRQCEKALHACEGAWPTVMLDCSSKCAQHELRGLHARRRRRRTASCSPMRRGSTCACCCRCWTW